MVARALNTDAFDEAQRLFSLCCLCINLAAQTKDQDRIKLLWKKHSQYAHKFRRAADKVKAMASAGS